MSRYLNDALRKKVIFRASGICEYCHISLDDTYFGGEIDHILSLKHAGKTILNNLTLACQPCNRNKGTDLGSISEITKKLVRFFNPRTDIWLEHFRANSDGKIEFLTEIGEVTATIFRFNDLERIAERKGLIEIGHYQL